MDGVIVHSNPVHSATWREYLQGCGVPVPDRFDERMYGMHNDQIVRMVFGPALDEAEVARHGWEKEKLYRQRIGPELERHLVRGVPAFLERYRDVPKAVATNAEEANLTFVLERGGLAGHFQATVHGGEVERPKPHPEVYLRAVERLGLRPEQCVAFEDSHSGIAAARAAGLRVVGVQTTHDQLPGAEVCIRDFADSGLEPWLTSQLLV